MGELRRTLPPGNAGVPIQFEKLKLLLLLLRVLVLVVSSRGRR